MAQRDISVLESPSQPEYTPERNEQGSCDASRRLLARSHLLWDSRHLLMRFAGYGFVLFVVIAFLIPAKYDSVTRLMPPDNNSSGGSMLAAFAAKGADLGAGTETLGGLAGDLLGSNSKGALFIGILRSRTVEDAIINKFNLLKVYRVRRMQDARQELEERTSMVEDRKSGIITISVRDQSQHRAQAMAQTYVDQLNIKVAALSTSSARREREFLETRLKSVKQDLDQAAQDFSQFASKNSAVDITEQEKAMVDAAARLQGELIAAEAQAQSLEQIYTPNNTRVRAAQATITELQRQLNKLGGADTETGEPTNETQLYPSIRELPLLGVKYSDLYRRTKIQEVVFEILTKQYELAKVEEAKEIPTVKVLDPADYPEKKASPHRLYIVLFGLILSLVTGCLWVLGSATWEEADVQDPRKQFLLEVFADAKHDWLALRNQFAIWQSKTRRHDEAS